MSATFSRMRMRSSNPNHGTRSQWLRITAGENQEA